MIRWTNLVPPIVAAAAAGAFAGIPFWEQSRQPFLVVLSVIATGILVRIARPQPFGSPDFYSVEEIRRLAEAMGRITRSLRTFFSFVVFAMVTLVIAPPLSLLGHRTIDDPSIAAIVDIALSAAMGFILGYVLVRMFEVVQGDEDLAKTQAEYIVRAVERRHARSAESLETSTVNPAPGGREGDGQRIQ